MPEKKERNYGLPLLLLLIAGAAALIFYIMRDDETSMGPGEKYDHDMDTEPFSQGILETELDYTKEDFADEAENQLGASYDSSGRSPDSGFDPPGYVQYVFEEAAGIRMPRLAVHQQDLGEDIGRNYLRTGDLVFFEGETTISGIYMENDEFITSTESGGVERLHLDEDDFWARNYTGAKRLTDDEIESLHPGSYSDHDHPAVREAMNYLSTPYEFGGESMEAFDCSFLIQDVYRESMNVYLPRVTIDQFEVGKDIDEEELRAGDVLYFSDIDVEDSFREDGEVTHAGIYVGNNFMIHASRTEGMTQISQLNDYWEDAFTGIKRFDEMAVEEEPIVETAAKYLNVPFERGGSDPSEGFNTSGFVRHVYEEAKGIQLPSRSRDMWENGEEISREELEPGDLVFFDGATGKLPGIYIGHDQFMITSESSGVTTRHLEEGDYFSDLYTGARRYRDS